jgi:hypothetical protein
MVEVSGGSASAGVLSPISNNIVNARFIAVPDSPSRPAKALIVSNLRTAAHDVPPRNRAAMRLIDNAPKRCTLPMYST